MNFRSSVTVPLCGLGILWTLLASPLQAEGKSPADIFLDEAFNTMRSMTDSNARDVASHCRAQDATLPSLQGVSEPMRLYLGSVIERCIYFAMNRGEFKDDSGDQCTHHMARAKKLAGAIEGWVKRPEENMPALHDLANDLENHDHNASLIGCKGDYTVFESAIKAAKEAK